MKNREPNRAARSVPPELAPWRFGVRPDQVEISRRGGIASGIARRLKDERQLEAKIVERNNGQAIYAVLRDRRAREAARDREVYRLDKEIYEMDEMLAAVREQVEETLAERQQAQVQLERVRAELDAAKSDHSALVMLLASIGEDRVARACDELGWIESESDALA